MFEPEDDVKYAKGVGSARAKLLEKLQIFTKRELLMHYPRTYEDRRRLTPIAQVRSGEAVIVAGRLSEIQQRRFRSGLSAITATLTDETGSLQVTWFNQDYLLKKLSEGTRILIIGKTRADVMFPEISQITSFTILEKGAEIPLGIVPVYPATAKLNQTFFRTAIKKLLEEMPPVDEIIPQSLVKELKLLPRDRAVRAIHFPASLEELEAARRRLAFDELFTIQCGLLLIKRQTQLERRGIVCAKNGALVEKVLAGLPFELTSDQKKVFAEVARDMESSVPMRRLIQGDVGSGKTVVAILALVKAVENGFQGALMAPTEILAEQHFGTFARILDGTGVRVGLLTSKMTRTPKLRKEIYRQITAHELDIVIGTHAIIQEGVQFAKLGLIITDEQHRFGVSQRAQLVEKSDAVPDMIVMTATPIPRTMTLTVYGDLDVSLIKKMPPGRKPIKTVVRNKRGRNKVYEFVRGEILNGRQAYVVCPLIEHSESERLSHVDSAEEIFERLSRGIFSDIPCALIHGRLKSEEIMADFRAGKIKLLVATTVIEVGVDVPNATIMVVENAERFGLSQLHQLRGRVGRGGEKSYCILISDSRESVAKSRLDLMESTSDGFVLAEEDLKIRGPGQFFGESQHGLPDLKAANIFRDVETLVEARAAAENFVANDFDTTRYGVMLVNKYDDRFRRINEA